MVSFGHSFITRVPLILEPEGEYDVRLANHRELDSNVLCCLFCVCVGVSCGSVRPPPKLLGAAGLPHILFVTWLTSPSVCELEVVVVVGTDSAFFLTTRHHCHVRLLWGVEDSISPSAIKLYILSVSGPTLMAVFSTAAAELVRTVPRRFCLGPPLGPRKHTSLS